jgi:hypothetical protein
MASVLEDVSMSDEMDFEDDVEAGLEVDELDPSDDEQQPAATVPPKGKSRKASTSKPGVRVPGHTLLPAARVESMLQSSGTCLNTFIQATEIEHHAGITNSALGMSKEGQFMLSIATVCPLASRYTSDTVLTMSIGRIHKAIGQARARKGETRKVEHGPLRGCW